MFVGDANVEVEGEEVAAKFQSNPLIVEPLTACVPAEEKLYLFTSKHWIYVLAVHAAFGFGFTNTVIWKVSVQPFTSVTVNRTFLVPGVFHFTPFTLAVLVDDAEFVVSKNQLYVKIDDPLPAVDNDEEKLNDCV